MKRKDNKGRVLKTGESQRKDLIYQYRLCSDLAGASPERKGDSEAGR